MIGSEVFGVADIHQAVIAAPPVRVDDGFSNHATANNGLQCGFLAVGHDFCVNTTVTLEESEDNGLAPGPAGSLATDSTSAEVSFINLDFATVEGRGALTFFRDAFSDSEKDRGDAAARKSCQLSGISGHQIERE